MSQIRSEGTKSEIRFRKELWKRGFRYRINVKKYPGKPDLLFKSQKVVVFIDGEFWHGFNWAIKKEKIKNNREYWVPKIEKNIQRDLKNNQYYCDQGWTVIRFWESDIKNNLENCIQLVSRKLNKNQ